MKLNVQADYFGLALFVLLTWGWVLNLLALVHSDHLTGLVIARALGVPLAPLGALLGWFA